MILAKEIDECTKKIKSLEIGVDMQWAASPSCQKCRGTGWHILSIADWCAAVKAEVEKQGDVYIGDAELTKDLLRNGFAADGGLRCFCECNTNDRYQAKQNEMKRREKLARIYKEIVETLGDERVKKTLADYRWPDRTTQYAIEKYVYCHGRPATSLFIHGAPRAGKTHIVSAIAQRLAVDGANVRVTADKKICDTGIGDITECNKWLDNLLRGCDVLYIDDVGMTRLTQRAAETYIAIFEYMCGTGKKLLMTSNYSRETLWQKQGDVPTDRMWRAFENCTILFLQKEKARAA